MDITDMDSKYMKKFEDMDLVSQQKELAKSLAELINTAEEIKEKIDSITNEIKEG